MTYEIRLDKKNGIVWNITNIITKAVLKLKRTGSCGTLTLSCVKGDAFSNKEFKFENGDVVQLYIDGVGRFYGYVFKVENKVKDQTYQVTCYDQIKYLLYKATYSFVNKKASEIIKSISEEFKLRVGSIADTQFVIPKLLEDDKKLLDIMSEALYLTSDNGGGQYCLYDDFGNLTLKALNDMKKELILADNTHIEDATYTVDIEDSYSIFKIVRDNKKTGKRDAFVYQNTDLINKWGMLQYFSKVDEDLNDAQIQKQLDALYGIKGKEKKTFSVKSIGEFVRAGESIAIVIEELEIKQFFVIDEVEHTFENGNVHNMNLILYAG